MAPDRPRSDDPRPLRHPPALGLARGQDGRPANKPGPIDDYWNNYDSEDVHSYADPDPDPYVLAGRPEHEPDCIGDFVGLSQLKWKNHNGECDGNVDAMAFIYWDHDGNKRANFVPPVRANGNTVVAGRNVPSGLARSVAGVITTRTSSRN